MEKTTLKEYKSCSQSKANRQATSSKFTDLTEQASGPKLRQRVKDLDSISNISQDPFRLDLRRGDKNYYRVEGSFRLVWFFISIFAAVVVLIVINWLLDSKCEQDFVEKNCSLKYPSPPCAKLVDCYLDSSKNYFGWASNFFLFFILQVILCCVCNIDPRPPKLSINKLKRVQLNEIPEPDSDK